MNPGTWETPFPIPPNWRWSQIAEIGVLSPRNEASDSTEASFVPMPLIAAEYGVDQIEARTRSSAASGRFTADGVKDDALNFTMSNLIPVFHRARTTIRKAKAEVAERRSRLKIEGPDKSDVAGAFRRREIRTFLREMKGNDQKNYFARYGDNLPGEVTMAILEMPPEFSGVPKSRHDLLTTKALEAQHGAEIAEIAELEEAIVSAESTVEIGRDEVRLEVGVLDERKFNEMAAPIEAKHDAPWLKRSKGPNGAEEIRVVDLDRGVERPATTRGDFQRSRVPRLRPLQRRKGSMTRETKTDVRLSTPVDSKKDQLEQTRRVLREMWDKADRAIDEQTGRSK